MDLRMVMILPVLSPLALERYTQHRSIHLIIFKIKTAITLVSKILVLLDYMANTSSYTQGYISMSSSPI